MNSPFPGMDPYLERRWLDLHTRLIVASSRAIQRQLGDDLVVNIEERVVVEDTLGYSRKIGPDLRVLALRRRRDVAPDVESAAGGVALAAAPTAAPIHLTELAEPVSERYLEIVDLSTGGRVITVIEFVSPSNKVPGDGWKQYRQKQDECFYAKVSLVEIDLTRVGDRTLLCHRWATARQYESVYQISVWDAGNPLGVDLYPITLREPLPDIKVPLRPQQPMATLKLQDVLAECYADARYDRTIDYAKPLDPPLGEEDAAWVRQIARVDCRSS